MGSIKGAGMTAGSAPKEDTVKEMQQTRTNVTTAMRDVMRSPIECRFRMRNRYESYIKAKNAIFRQ